MLPRAIDRAADTATRIHRSATRLTHELRSRRPEGSISVLRLSLLAHLHREGAKTPGDLARYLKIRPQSLTRLLVDLEEREWLERTEDPKDRRRALIDITDIGAKALAEDVRARRTELARAVARLLSPEEQDLLHAAAELMDRLTAAIAGDKRIDERGI